MFIPKLNEEEARFLVLRHLSSAPKSQGTVEEIRHSIRSTRQMGEEDLRPNPTRSNAPMWYQIVQNSTDRFILPRGYVEIISPSPNKIIRLTNDGRRFLKPYVEMFERQPDLETHTFFDNTILESLFSRNKAIFAKAGIRSAEKFCDFMKSRAAAKILSQSMESQGFATTLFDGLEEHFSTASMTPQDEAAFRTRQVRAWRKVRDDFDPITEALAEFFKPNAAQ